VILTPVHPRVEPPIDIFAADARERITELYRLRSPDGVRINLIASVSGSAAGSDGTSETLSSPADRLILKVIRALSDVVVVGAASVRAEGYFVPKDGALAVVSRSGDFTGHHIRDTGNHGTLLILCPASSVRTAQSTIGLADVTVVPVPDVDGSLSAGAIVGTLRNRGFHSIVAEGGPTLAKHLVLGGVANELCLTTSPVLNGGALPLFGPQAFAGLPLTLEQVLIDDRGFTYARWGLSGPTAVD
jgi:riboflavin biosynthesis pyrimidine reductase